MSSFLRSDSTYELTLIPRLWCQDRRHSCWQEASRCLYVHQQPPSESMSVHSTHITHSKVANQSLTRPECKVPNTITTTSSYQTNMLMIGNKSVTKIIITDTVNLFLMQSPFCQFQTITVSECCLIKLLPYILAEKYIYILALEMARPGNQQHCASCIGTHLLFPLFTRYDFLLGRDRTVIKL